MNAQGVRLALECVGVVLLAPLAVYGGYRAFDDYAAISPFRFHPAVNVASQSLMLPPPPSKYAGELIDMQMEEGLTFGIIRQLRKLLGAELEDCVLYVPADPSERAILCLKREGAKTPHGIMLPPEFHIEMVSSTSDLVPPRETETLVVTESLIAPAPEQTAAAQ